MQRSRSGPCSRSSTGRRSGRARRWQVEDRDSVGGRWARHRRSPRSPHRGLEPSWAPGAWPSARVALIRDRDSQPSFADTSAFLRSAWRAAEHARERDGGRPCRTFPAGSLGDLPGPSLGHPWLVLPLPACRRTRSREWQQGSRSPSEPSWAVRDWSPPAAHRLCRRGRRAASENLDVCLEAGSVLAPPGQAISSGFEQLADDAGRAEAASVRAHADRLLGHVLRGSPEIGGERVEVHRL